MKFTGTIIPISTVDWYGKASCVIFFDKCNFNCIYCSNYEFMKTERDSTDIKEIEKQILDIRPFISAVVFSGGEPAMHTLELEHLAKFAKYQKLLVGIETNGYYTDNIKKLIENRLLDKIFLDVKCSPYNSRKYYMITGIKDAADHVLATLNLKDVCIEVRTTAFKSLTSEADIIDISSIVKSTSDLIRNSVSCITYAIQQGIPENAPDKELRTEKPLTADELIKLTAKVRTKVVIRVRS